MATIEQYLDEAASELGTTESPPGSNRTEFASEAGHANGQPWCATFLVAIARRVGLALPSESAYTPTMANGFRATKRWHADPLRGDIAFFDFPDSKRRIQHVGVVESATATTVTCIEGNTAAGWAGSQDNGGGVWRRTRPRSYVVGYGRPAYSSAGAGERPIAPPAGAPTVVAGPTYEDSSMQPHFVSLHANGARLDGKGNGYWDLEQFSFDRVVGVNPNIANPPEAGYNVPDVGWLRWGSGIRVVAEEAVAGGGLDVVVWTVG